MDEAMTGAGVGATEGVTGEAPSCFIELSKDSGAPVIFDRSRTFAWSANSESFE
jgi:hypothetical protein